MRICNSVQAASCDDVWTYPPNRDQELVRCSATSCGVGTAPCSTESRNAEVDTPPRRGVLRYRASAPPGNGN